jgi:hypothetical protein
MEVNKSVLRTRSRVRRIPSGGIVEVVLTVLYTHHWAACKLVGLILVRPWLWIPSVANTWGATTKVYVHFLHRLMDNRRPHKHG